MAEDFNVQELIPWEGVHVKTQEELYFLGRNNIFRIWKYWREQSRDLESKIDQLKVRINVLDGKNVSGTVMEKWVEDQAKLIAENEDVKAKIGYLESIMETVLEEKPLLVAGKTKYDFEVGEKVMFLVPKFNNVIPDKVSTFVAGVVVGTTCPFAGELTVPISTDTRVHTSDYLGGYGVNATSNMPELIKEWEYDYFKSHPDFFRVWAANLPAEARAYGFNIEAVAKSLATT